jgi:hypothetical protein
MSALGPAQLRKAAAACGLTPASWVPEASEGRAEQATFRPVRLVEAEALGFLPVGKARPWPGPVAFLDGVQRYQIVAYAGVSPVVWAEIAAAVRERAGRRLRTMAQRGRRILVGRPDALAALRGADHGCEEAVLPDDEPPHPIRDFTLVRRTVDTERGRLEVEVGHRYRLASPHWLIVDGSLAQSPQWAADPRMLGVMKSHASLPFTGSDLERYLRLPAGCRTTVFSPAGDEVAPVYSWAFRLWPWEGRDLFHGLIRVEAAPTEETMVQAGEICRWLLAERAPVSTPDPRWDRLLYGIHAVEEFLKARG